jgi:methyl-accepting chemotaxis protein
MLSRLTTALSVRSRLIILSLLPVVGFAAIALSYISSEHEVDTAFGSVQQSSRLAEASRAFKEALTTMHMRAKDFVALPQLGLIARFDDAHSAATANLHIIEGLVADAERPNLVALKERVANLKTTFAALTAEQDNLGLTEFEGIQGSLRDNGNGMEQVVNFDLAGLSDSDRQKTLVPLMLMRRYEVEYRLTRAEPVYSLFKQQLGTFEKAFAAIVATAALKQRLTDQVKAYTTAFADWIASTDKIGRANAIISAETRQMLPAADEIIASATGKASAAAEGVAVTQAQTKLLIFGIGIAVVLIGLGLNFLIGRSITRPLAGLSGAMEKLAAGDTSVDIPATGDQDEIGAMARTVIVFRDNALEREQLAVTQQKAVRERERRTETIAATIVRFEDTVDEALGKVRGAAQRLETASIALNSAADAVSAESNSAEQRVGAASMNVASAASSAEELAHSIGEIATQAATSTDVASRAVTEAQRTVRTMSQLATAATRIGEVIGLIQAIAGQTNLLALNATIEAARAGDAGRGFAVVASEVKNLANQAKQATDKISSEIDSLNGISGEVVGALNAIKQEIQNVSEYVTATAAAVEEQSTVTSEMSSSMQRAAEEAAGMRR